MQTRRNRIVMQVCLWGLVAAWAPCLWAQADVAAALKPVDPTTVLRAIPADSTAFMVVRNLSETNKDLVEIARALGFSLGSGPESIFPAPLEWAKESFGLNNGLADNGSVAFVVPNCQDAQTIDEVTSRVAILLPTSDPNALIASLGPQKDGDVTTVNLAGEPYVATKRDGFVVLGRTAEAAKAAASAGGEGILSKMSPDRIKAYASSDVFAWGTPKGVSAAVRAEAQQALGGFMAMAGVETMPAADEQMKEINNLMDETEEVSGAITVDQRGLGLSGCFRVKPGSELARRMNLTKVSEGPLLTGLPNEPTVLAAGVVTAAGRVEDQMRKAVDAMFSPPPEGASPEDIKQLKDALINLWSTTDRVGVSLSNVPTESGQSTVGLTIVAEVKDSRKWTDSAHRAFDLGKSMIAGSAKAEGQDEAQVRAVMDGVQWKKAAGQAGDLPIEQITVDLSKLPDFSPEDIEAMKGLFGSQGMAVQIVNVDDRHVVLAVGGGLDRLGRICETVKKGEAPLASSESVQKVASRMPEGPRLMEGYLNVDQALNLFSNVMTRMNQPLPVQLTMRNAAPLAFTVTRVDDTAQEVHVIVPVELMVSIKETAAPLVQMFLGGMGGGEEPPVDMDSEEPDSPEPLESELK